MSIDVFDRDFLTQNFDEQAYLDLYGDVATAVADPNDPFTLSPDADVDGDGVITGLDHYLIHGFGEGRTAPLLTDLTPTPPTVSFTPSAPQPV